MNKTRFLFFAGALLVSCCALYAQDSADKVHIPLHDAARPARIRAHLINGGITVVGADVKDVTVETRGSARSERRRSRERSDPKADGMKRLDFPGTAGFEAEEDNNVVTIKSSPWNQGSDFVITVPRRSSLQLKCLNNGDINVEGVEGEIDADDLNGKVTLKNVAGSVLAHSLNGTITVSLDRIDTTKPMSFSTLNGDIDVTLPGDIRANVRMKTDNGEIYSDFEVKLIGDGSAIQRDSGRSADGKYRVRLDRAMRGTINGGGPEYQFTSFNGRIYIRRKK